MDSREDYLDALTEFSRRQPKEIPPLLEQFLKQVAKTGETLFPWTLLKRLFITKLEQVINEFSEEYEMDEPPVCPNVENARFDVYKSRIMEAVYRFHGAPFTIQRLCELLMDPRRHYKRADKFMRGLEKNVLVVSTVDPFGKKVVSESKNLINGMEEYEEKGDDTEPASNGCDVPPVPSQTSSTSTSWPLNADVITPSTSPLLEVSDLPDPRETGNGTSTCSTSKESSSSSSASPVSGADVPSMEVSVDMAMDSASDFGDKQSRDSSDTVSSEQTAGTTSETSTGHRAGQPVAAEEMVGVEEDRDHRAGQPVAAEEMVEMEEDRDHRAGQPVAAEEMVEMEEDRDHRAGQPVAAEEMVEMEEDRDTTAVSTVTQQAASGPKEAAEVTPSPATQGTEDGRESSEDTASAAPCGDSTESSEDTASAAPCGDRRESSEDTTSAAPCGDSTESSEDTVSAAPCGDSTESSEDTTSAAPCGDNTESSEDTASAAPCGDSTESSEDTVSAAPCGDSTESSEDTVSAAPCGDSTGNSEDQTEEASDSTVCPNHNRTSAIPPEASPAASTAPSSISDNPSETEDCSRVEGETGGGEAEDVVDGSVVGKETVHVCLAENGGGAEVDSADPVSAVSTESLQCVAMETSLSAQSEITKSECSVSSETSLSKDSPLSQSSGGITSLETLTTSSVCVAEVSVPSVNSPDAVKISEPSLPSSVIKTSEPSTCVPRTATSEDSHQSSESLMDDQAASSVSSEVSVSPSVASPLTHLPESTSPSAGLPECTACQSSPQSAESGASSIPSTDTPGTPDVLPEASIPSATSPVCSASSSLPESSASETAVPDVATPSDLFRTPDEVVSAKEEEVAESMDTDSADSSGSAPVATESSCPNSSGQQAADSTGPEPMEQD